MVKIRGINAAMEGKTSERQATRTESERMSRASDGRRKTNLIIFQNNKTALGTPILLCTRASHGTNLH